MRTLFTAFILVLIVNTLALAGLAGWMGATGRINKDRVKEAVALFSNTIQEQAALEEEAEKAEQEAIELAEKAMRLEQVAGGPVTPDARFAAIQRVDAKRRALIERQKVEAEALQKQINLQRRLVESKIAELDEKQKAFDQAVASQLTEMEEEDFKEAVAMLEGITAKQAKAVFQELLRSGDDDQVVSYLSAMEERKAAGVLKEFKQPNEVAQAAALIEKLRQRTEEVKEEANL